MIWAKPSGDGKKHSQCSGHTKKTPVGRNHEAGSNPAYSSAK